MYSYREKDGTSNFNVIFSNSSPAQAAQMNFEYKQELDRQHKKYSEKLLRENYPTKFVIAYTSLIISIGVSLIVLQIIYYASNGVNQNYASGIWAGFIYVVAGSLAASIIKWRLPSLIIVKFFFNFFAIFSSVVTIILNSVSLTFYSEEWLFVNDGEVNQNMKHVNIAMIVLAFISLVLLITFLIVVNLALNKQENSSGPIQLENIPNNESNTTDNMN
ncbi:hypothetical protein BpHYR1_006857 [Brachionus plicatilis]|uniref:Uncharacterized protein n=1 Tax=Brachionus plicatilis TaxID=10195 RepID=A0A3M7P9G6_BRAPC|nr:hypothetical protein BpHYR1_006857 [Brachionus plicatilis]